MTATTTTGIRISPHLWAEFGLLCKRQGKTRNGELVNMVRDRVVTARKDTTTHSAKEESDG